MGDPNGRLVLMVRDLKEERKRQGVTQESIAWALSVTQTYVSYMESGRKTPTLKQLDEWADYLGWELVFEMKKRRRKKEAPKT